MTSTHAAILLSGATCATNCEKSTSPNSTMPGQYHVRLSAEVLRDLEGIHAYIAKDSISAASKMIQTLLDAIDSLEVLPHRAVVERQSAKLKYPVRSLAVPPYVIYFRV